MVIPGEGGGHVVLRTLISVLRWQGVQIGLDMFMGSILGGIDARSPCNWTNGIGSTSCCKIQPTNFTIFNQSIQRINVLNILWLLFKRDRILSLDHATNDNREWQQIPWMPNPQRGGLWSTLTCILKWRFLLTLVSTHK